MAFLPFVALALAFPCLKPSEVLWVCLGVGEAGVWFQGPRRRTWWQLQQLGIKCFQISSVYRGNLLSTKQKKNHRPSSKSTVRRQVVIESHKMCRVRGSHREGDSKFSESRSWSLLFVWPVAGLCIWGMNKRESAPEAAVWTISA